MTEPGENKTEDAEKPELEEEFESPERRDPPEEFQPKQSVNVINFWSIVILLVSAASVAAVVGAAVVAGEFDDPEDDDPIEVEADVLIMPVEGGTEVTWSDPGEADSIAIRDGANRIATLEYVGDSEVVREESFQVFKVSEDGSTTLIKAHGPEE